MTEEKSFWTTLPGILTGFATLITAATGAYLALVKEPQAEIGSKEPPSNYTTKGDATVSTCDERVSEAWEIAQSQRGGALKFQTI